MSINRVLTDIDRENYENIIKELYEKVPDITYRKISTALVQQAFIVDSIRNLVKLGGHILSAGDYEDNAAELLRLEYDVFGIDPINNWSLHQFRMVHNDQFDAVISTSVLEHVENWQEFIEDICFYLKPGGFGVLTCDFKNEISDRVPSTSYRFFTNKDLLEILPTILEKCNCKLVDIPDYSAIDNFSWEGIQYSFATIVFQRS